MINLRLGTAHLPLDSACSIDKELYLHILEDVIVHVVEDKVDIDLGQPLELCREIHLIQFFKELVGLAFIRREAE